MEALINHNFCSTSTLHLIVNSFSQFSFKLFQIIGVLAVTDFVCRTNIDKKKRTNKFLSKGKVVLILYIYDTLWKCALRKPNYNIDITEHYCLFSQNHSTEATQPGVLKLKIAEDYVGRDIL